MKVPQKLSLKKEKDKEVIAVDLDGVLAEYTEWKSIDHFGAPIQKMIDRVKKWIKEGKTVVIFTARIDNNDSNAAEKYVEDWLEEQGIRGLKITNIKTHDIIELWDDHAVQLIPNTGERVDGKDD